MKPLILLFLLSPFFTIAQKTTRQIISNSKGISITRIIKEEPNGEVDTVFMMSGQNVKYTHITDIIIVKYGQALEVNELLSECMKTLPEASGTSMEFNGNEIHSAGNGRILVYGIGDSKHGCVLLNKNAIVKLQTDLRPHL